MRQQLQQGEKFKIRKLHPILQHGIEQKQLENRTKTIDLLSTLHPFELYQPRHHVKENRKNWPNQDKMKYL